MIKKIQKIRDKSPICIKNLNIYFFEEFGVGIIYQPGFMLTIILLFVTINIGLPIRFQ